jgi:hypothetical protein
MGLINIIKKVFGGGNAPAGRDKHIYVVDGARMLDERNGRRLGPRDQLQVLNMLDRVSQQEGFAIQAVLESERPLREVDDGGEFGHVRVYFAKDSEALAEKMLELCGKGKDYVLVGTGSRLELDAAKAGISMMSVSTFRRAFGQGNDGGRRGGGDRGERRNGNGGRRRHRGGRGRNGGRGGQTANPAGADVPQAQDGASAAPAASAPASAEVNKLIDLVD